MTRAFRRAAPPPGKILGLGRGDLKQQTLRKRGTDDDLLWSLRHLCGSMLHRVSPHPLHAF